MISEIQRFSSRKAEFSDPPRGGMFRDRRDPAYTEHAVETLIMQCVVGIALGYEAGTAARDRMERRRRLGDGLRPPSRCHIAFNS